MFARSIRRMSLRLWVANRTGMFQKEMREGRILEWRTVALWPNLRCCSAGSSRLWWCQGCCVYFHVFMWAHMQHPSQNPGASSAGLVRVRAIVNPSGCTVSKESLVTSPDEGAQFLLPWVTVKNPPLCVLTTFVTG